MIQSSESYIPAAETIYNQNQPFWWDAARIIEDDFTFPLYEKAPSEKKQNRGKKKELISAGKTGHYIRAVPAEKDYADIAPAATIRSAAGKQFQRLHVDDPVKPAVLIKPADIMKRVRIRKNSSLIVFLVDLSWSMAVTQRMAATKKAISLILNKAYQFRDDICLITFHENHADVIISPTHSITLAEKAMKKMSVGGKTPLPAGLMLAHEILNKESRKYGRENIALVLLSDCEANVPLSSADDPDPQAEAVAEAKKIASEGYHSIVINSDQMSFGQGYSNSLAKHLNAACYLISGFNEDHLLNTLRSELIL